MVPESIMDDCIRQLLRAMDERALECFCQLIMIVGKKLDHYPLAKVYKKEMLHVIILHCHSNVWINILKV